MRFLSLALVSLVAVAMLATACGDDDDRDSTEPTGDGADAGLGFPLTPPDDAVTTASGLQYIDLQAGTGPTPTHTTTTSVTVHYRGLLPDGTQFDSSYDRGTPAEFQLGGVIPGFAEGIATMNTGGHRVLYIPGELAYGAAGNPRAGIGPNQPLIFEVELIASS